MDFATVIGMIGAALLLGLAVVMGGDLRVFLDMPALLVVMGGSSFVVMSKFGLGQFAGALRVAGQAFLLRLDDPATVIAQIVELAAVARRGGLLSLKEQKVDNRFLGEGLQMLVEGSDPEAVKTTLGKDRSLALGRHEWGQRIFLALADAGPAMGLMGTLIGLVQMLSSMDDPKALGPALALALLAMLYGVALANLVFLPIAEKLQLRGSQESALQALIIDGLLGIQAGQNPRSIHGMLDRYLPESERSVLT